MGTPTTNVIATVVMAGPRAQPVVRSHVSPTSPLHPSYISAISPLHLPYISPTSPLYLPHISPYQVHSFREIEGGEAAHQSLGLLGQVHG